jgi:hypothetical protein
MTASRDPDRLIRAFLMEGEEMLQDQVYDEVRAAIEHRRQRVYFGPWRTPIMNRIVTFGLGAAAVVAALFIAVQLLSSPDGGTGGQSTPSATPGATQEPTPEATPSPSADAFLPDGPILIWDPQLEAEGPQGGATITVTISAPEWQFHDDYQYLQKGTDGVDDAVVWPGSLPPGTGYYVYGDPCRWESTRPENPASTVDDIVAALAAQPTLDASEPVDVTIGGYAGKAVSLHVPEDANHGDCDGGEAAMYQVEGLPAGPSLVYGEAGQTNELWFLDVEGSIVMLLGRYLPDTPDESVEELRAIVESATFEVP